MRVKTVRNILLVLLAFVLAACSSSQQAPADSFVKTTAPGFTLDDALGGQTSLSDYSGTPVLLFFHMAVGCSPCMQQIVDLQNSSKFQALNVPVISIARDSVAEMAPEAQTLGISSVPVLSDPDLAVSADYDVLQWAIDNGEPSHTFVLVDADGQIVWVKDYGAPDNPDRTMYVEVDELIDFVEANLEN